MLAGSILQKLRDAYALGQSGGRSLSLGVYYKNTLVALCHALEDALLDNDYEPLMITAFQRGQWYLQEAERYRDLAARSQQVVIMASPDAGFWEHPTGQRSNVSLVGLDETDPVGQEWHLIIVSPRYTAMVLCQELTEADYGAAGLPQHDLERKFYGLWTFEPGLVTQTASIAADHLQRYNPDLASQLQERLAQLKATIADEDTSEIAPPGDHLGDVVGRVVNYLQTSQQDLFQHDTMGFDAYPKVLDKNLLSNELQAFLRMAQLIDQTDLSNPMAAAEVATLAESLGQLLDLPAWQLHRLRLAGLLHRIAAMPTIQPTLPKGEVAATDSQALSCPLVPGTQVLRRMNRMRAIATILTHLTEAWDGSGFPAALSGDAIPLESRLLGLVACFQQRLAAQRPDVPSTGALDNASPEALANALSQCQAEASHRWDPKMVEALTLLVNGLQQGLSLSVAKPQVASGLWLLDSHSDEDLYSLTPTAS